MFYKPLIAILVRFVTVKELPILQMRFVIFKYLSDKILVLVLRLRD